MTFARNILLAVGLVACAVSPAGAREEATTAGRSVKMLAHVALTSRNGMRVQLGSRVTRGKPTLVAFWASWCMPCLVEAPYLNKIRKDLGGTYNFLYIDRRDGEPDSNQSPAAVAQFLTRSGMADVDYLTADVAAYRRILGPDIKGIPDGLVGIPRIYLFDRKGRQIYTSYGFSEADGPRLERLVKQAVTER